MTINDHYDMAELHRKADEHHAQRAERIAELGWQQTTDNRCPRLLVRKHCRNQYEYSTCWCSSHLNDHAATYIDNEANRCTRFTLWEPYGAPGEELAELIAAAHQDGLRVDITASVWNPPHTIGIRFEAARFGTLDHTSDTSGELA